jgi:hypothetical protein
MVLPEELPALEVVSSTILPSWLVDFPRELVSVLVGVVVTLVSLGLTSTLSHRIEKKREQDETFEMLEAALRATIAILGTDAAGPVPVDTLQSACSSPHFERLLARIRRSQSRHPQLGKTSQTVDEIAQALIDLQAEANYYGQVYVAQKGDVAPDLRDSLKEKAKILQSLLRGL